MCTAFKGLHVVYRSRHLGCTFHAVTVHGEVLSIAYRACTAVRLPVGCTTGTQLKPMCRLRHFLAVLSDFYTCLVPVYGARADRGKPSYCSAISVFTGILFGKQGILGNIVLCDRIPFWFSV